MPNSYYNHTTFPATSAPGSSALARAEFDAVTNGFALLPTLTGNAGKIVQVDATGTSLVASNVVTVSVTGLVFSGIGTVISMPRFSDGNPALFMGGRAGSALSLYNAGGVTSEILVDAGVMTFSTNTVERARITTTGLVTMQNGLAVTGAVSASALLSVGVDQVLPTNGYNISAPSYGGAIELRGNGATTNRGWRIGMRDNAAGFVPHLSYIESVSSGLIQALLPLNVAIGTDSAVYRAGIRLEGAGVTSGSVSAALEFSGANVNAAIWSVRSSAFGGNLVLATQSTGGGQPLEQMRIDAVGNVGIGNPSVPAIGGTGPILDLYNASTQPAITFHNSASTNASLRGAMVRLNGSLFGLHNFETAGPITLNTVGGTATYDAQGNWITTAPAAPPTLGTNQQMVMNLTTNTNLRVSARGSDGVTRTVNLTLT